MEHTREIWQTLAALVCKRCGETGHTIKGPKDPGPTFPHYGAAVCLACGNHAEWIAWPKDKDDRERSRKLRIRTYSPLDTCCFCGRTAAQIPPFDNRPDASKFEVDHIQPKADAGSDDPSNTRLLCKFCHGLRTHLSIYLGHYRGEA